VKTLVKGKENEIVSTCDVSIAVKSRETKNRRIISKDDFRYAWNNLKSKRTIKLQDIDPILRGRKSIVFAFLARLPYVDYELSPILMIRLKKNIRFVGS